MYTSDLIVLGWLIAAPLASAHGLISTATGDLGGNGTGLGVVSGGVNSQADVTIFSAKAGAFGETTGGGNIVPATALAAQQKLTGDLIPQVSANAGVLTMTFHQINADGAGPIACSISTDATGKTFTAITVSTNVPGTNGKSNAANEDFPLIANIPAGTACTGTVGALTNVCAVKCANQVGPFGGTVLVQQAAAKKRDILGDSLAARAKVAVS